MISLSIKEKIKNLWKTYKKGHLMFFAGSLFGINFVNWTLFFFGIIDLHAPLLFSIFTALLTIIALLLKTKHKLIVAKIVYIGMGGFAVGVGIWFILLFTARWLPFLRGRILLLLLIPACGLGALIMYVVGKKRNWKTIFTYKNETS